MPTDPLHGEPPVNAAPASGRIVVELFAGLAEVAGTRRLEVPWSGGTVAELRAVLRRGCPAIGPLLDRSAVAVAGRYTPDDARLIDGSEVALIPPVSGG